MSRFIDRRLNGKNKSAVNRQRFIKRFKQQIKKAVAESVSNRSITDTERGEKISIPARDLSEPKFHHGEGGLSNSIHAGNKDFMRGDRLKRPPSGGSGGQSEASDQGEGEDSFDFEISREEYLDLLFDDLELPNLVKTKLMQLESFQFVHAGYSSVGVPAQLNIVRSMRSSYARRLALGGPHRKQVKDYKEELAALEQSLPRDEEKIAEIKAKIKLVKERIGRIPFLDPIDLRYNLNIPQPKPSTQAVMFCVMDVSGSMGQATKEIAKRFFILLYLFLNRSYKKTKVVFIRHHTSAKEVDEQEFFYSRETGGTIVSSSLKLLHKIIQQRFPTDDWNIYAAQASDGDNWGDDSPYCRKLLLKKILPLIQYFSYIEITRQNPQSLWQEYSKVNEENDNFALKRIESVGEIYPIFRELFQRKLA